jgi:hypothetical protein
MRQIIIALLFLGLAGCDAASTLKEGLAQSELVAKHRRKHWQKPLAGFNLNNGSLSSVDVTFQELPHEKSWQEITTLATNSIKKIFKQPPEQVVISFVVNPAKL